MAYEALRHYADAGHHVPVRVQRRLHRLRRGDPRPGSADETLFIISSKTFGTLETLTNANSARDWVVGRARVDGRGGQALRRGLDQRRRVAAFGIDTANMFGFWDWVGGRYSMDSAIGLSTMVAIGPDQFDEMLAGFHEMDEHFRTAPLERNLPVLMGLLAVWYRDFFGGADRRRDAVRPVPQAVPRLPAAAHHGVQRQARHAERAAVDYDTGAVYWGEPGTNGQHSFYQLIHQGTTLIPVDLIGFGKTLNPLGDHHDILSSNVFAQAAGAGLRQDRGRGPGRGHGRARGAAPGDGGQPADQRAAGRDPDAAAARRRWSRCTSTACSPRERSGTSTRSTSGAWSSGKVLAVSRSSPS